MLTGLQHLSNIIVQVEHHFDRIYSADNLKYWGLRAFLHLFDVVQVRMSQEAVREESNSIHHSTIVLAAFCNESNLGEAWRGWLQFRDPQVRGSDIALYQEGSVVVLVCYCDFRMQECGANV